MGRNIEYIQNGSRYHENGSGPNRRSLNIKERVALHYGGENGALSVQAIRHPESFYGQPSTGVALQEILQESESSIVSPQQEIVMNHTDSPSTDTPSTDTPTYYRVEDQLGTTVFESQEHSKYTDQDGEVAPSFGPKIHISMFDPDPSKVKMPALISQFFGRDAVMYASHRFMSPQERRTRKIAHVGTENKPLAKQYDRRKTSTVRQHRSSVDTSIFAERVAAAYGLDENQNPLDFYESAMRHSNSTIQSMIEHTLPRQKGVVGLKTEPGLIIDDPDTLFEYAFDPGIDDRAQFEVRRQLLVGIVCAELNLYMQRSGLVHNLRKVDRLFNNDLFAGKKSESHRRDFVFVHDKKTNSVVAYYDASQFKRDEKTGDLFDVPHDPKRQRVREEPFEMRRIKGTDIDVRYDPRIKGMSSAAGKAIQDALKAHNKGQDGTVLPLVEGRKDLMGMLFVVDGDEKAADDVLHKIFDTMAESPLADTLYDVIPDYETNKSEDQSNEFNLGRRIRVKGIGNNNLPIQWEIIVQPLIANKNGNEHIGEMDPETGRYNGQWHDGYTTERLIKGENGGMLKLMIPDRIYNREGRYIDFVAEAGKTKNRKGELIRLP